MKSCQAYLCLALILLLAACDVPGQEITPDTKNSVTPDVPDSPPVSATPSPRILNVDDYGANPFDDQPDSSSIQAALNDLKRGETLQFSSGEGDEGYQGYLIDETLFIIWETSHTDIVLTSTDPDNPALLQETKYLRGFVIRLFSRKMWWRSPGFKIRIWFFCCC